MTDQIKELVHIGVNAELSYLATVDEESLYDAVKIVDLNSNFENLEEEIGVEDFVSAVNEIHSLVLYGDDKENPRTFFKNETISSRLRSFIFSSLGLVASLATGAFVIGYLDLFESKESFLALSIIVPAFLVVLGFLLMKGALPVSRKFVAYPAGLKEKIGNYTLEVVGTGLVQLFFEDTTDQDGMLKAKYVLGIEENAVDEDIYLTHFVMLSKLEAIYLWDTESKSRISKNLLPPLRRRLVNSSFDSYLIGSGIGLGLVAIPSAIANFF